MIMTTTMYWRPAPKDEPPENDLPDGLKRILARRYWNHDGTLHGDAVRLDRNTDRAYLEGLVDANVYGSGDLLTAVLKHGAVEIWIGE